MFRNIEQVDARIETRGYMLKIWSAICQELFKLLKCIQNYQTEWESEQWTDIVKLADPPALLGK